MQKNKILLDLAKEVVKRKKKVPRKFLTLRFAKIRKVSILGEREFALYITLVSFFII